MYTPFTYYVRTKVVFGPNTENQAGSLVKEFGGTKVLVHYGSQSAVRSGLLDRVLRSLDEAGVSHVELGGVVPNPHLSKVYEGIELGKKENVDFLLAVGGGSVIDSAKSIALGLASGGDVWDFYIKKRKPGAALPVGSVLTIAAAGSETSDSNVITDDRSNLKRDCGGDCLRPKFAIMNPELTHTLPDYQTASGCVDIIAHSMERYFNPGVNLEFTDGLSEYLMRTVIKNARILAKDPQNADARAEVMWAGSLSHNGLTGCGLGRSDWGTHNIEHEMGGLFDVTHGAGLAVIWPSWARYVHHAAPHRFLRFAVNVMGVERDDDDEITIERGIQAVEQFYRDINMPTTMLELGITPTEEQILWMAASAEAKNGDGVGSVIRLKKEDIAKIYRMAL